MSKRKRGAKKSAAAGGALANLGVDSNKENKRRRTTKNPRGSVLSSLVCDDVPKSNNESRGGSILSSLLCVDQSKNTFGVLGEIGNHRSPPRSNKELKEARSSVLAQDYGKNKKDVAFSIFEQVPVKESCAGPREIVSVFEQLAGQAAPTSNELLSRKELLAGHQEIVPLSVFEQLSGREKPAIRKSKPALADKSKPVVSALVPPRKDPFSVLAAPSGNGDNKSRRAKRRGKRDRQLQGGRNKKISAKSAPQTTKPKANKSASCKAWYDCNELSLSGTSVAQDESKTSAPARVSRRRTRRDVEGGLAFQSKPEPTTFCKVQAQPDASLLASKVIKSLAREEQTETLVMNDEVATKENCVETKKKRTSRRGSERVRSVSREKEGLDASASIETKKRSAAEDKKKRGRSRSSKAWKKTESVDGVTAFASSKQSVVGSDNGHVETMPNVSPKTVQSEAPDKLRNSEKEEGPLRPSVEEATFLKETDGLRFMSSWCTEELVLQGRPSDPLREKPSSRVLELDFIGINTEAAKTLLQHSASKSEDFEAESAGIKTTLTSDDIDKRVGTRGRSMSRSHGDSARQSSDIADAKSLQLVNQSRKRKHRERSRRRKQSQSDKTVVNDKPDTIQHTRRSRRAPIPTNRYSPEVKSRLRKKAVEVEDEPQAETATTRPVQKKKKRRNSAQTTDAKITKARPRPSASLSPRMRVSARSRHKTDKYSPSKSKSSQQTLSPIAIDPTASTEKVEDDFLVDPDQPPLVIHRLKRASISVPKSDMINNAPNNLPPKQNASENSCTVVRGRQAKRVKSSDDPDKVSKPKRGKYVSTPKKGKGKHVDETLCDDPGFWTEIQLFSLRNAHTSVDPRCVNFWEEVASTVDGKNEEQCKEKWFALVKTPVPKKKKARNRATGHTSPQTNAAPGDEEDDLFNATPMRSQYMSDDDNDSHGPVETTFDFDVGSPIIDEGHSGTFQENEYDDGTETAAPISRVGYKSYIQNMRRDISRAAKAKKRKNQALSIHQGGPRVLSGTIDHGDLEVNGSLTPGGTVRLRTVDWKDEEEDDFFDDSDDDEEEN